MITLENKTAEFIYNVIQKELPDIEPFFYFASNEKNNGLVFLPNDIDYIEKYFGEEKIFSYRILHFSAKMDFAISINKIEKVIDILQNWDYANDKIVYNMSQYKIDLTYINQKAAPSVQWLRPELIDLGNESQTYSLTFGIKLYKI